MHPTVVLTPNNSFPKNKRLLNPYEFQHVFEHQKKLYYRGIVVYYRENSLGYPRLGVVAAKKHFKKASTRNFIKRQIREYFRQHQESLGNKDLVIVATHKLIENKSWSIPPLLGELWSRLADAA